jgi:hypothetical protein
MSNENEPARIVRMSRTTARYVCDPVVIVHGWDMHIVARIASVVLDHVAAQAGPDEDVRCSWFVECHIAGPEGLEILTLAWDTDQPLPSSAVLVICQGWSWAPRRTSQS